MMMMNSSNFHRTDHYKDEYKKLVDYLENNLMLLAAPPTPTPTAAGSNVQKKSTTATAKATANLTSSSPSPKRAPQPLASNTSIDSFIKSINKADLADREAFSRYSRLSQGLNNLAYAFNRLGEHEKAAECYTKSLKLKEALVNQSKMSIRIPSKVPKKKTGDLSAAKLNKRRAVSAAPNIPTNVQAASVKSEPDAVASKQANKSSPFGKSKAASLALTYSNLGATYSYMNDHESSITHYKRALELLGSLDKQKQLNAYQTTSRYQTAVANQLSNIAIALNRLNRHEEALRSHFEALEIREFVHAGESDRPIASLDLAQTLSNIGNTYYQLNDLKKANAYLERSLKMRESLRDSAEQTNSASSQTAAINAVASTHYNLGVVNFYMENNEKALRHFERALQLRSMTESEAEEASRGVSRATDEGLLASQEDRDEDDALPSKNKLLMMDGNLDCYNHIGNLLFKMGRFNEAIEYFHKELAVFDEILRLRAKAGNHKDDYYLKTNKAGCLNNIGASYASLKDYVSAIEYMKRSLEIREQLFDGQVPASLVSRSPRAHPDLANSLNNLGVVHYNLNEFEKSSDYFEKTLKIREEENRQMESQNWRGLSSRKQRVNLRQLENTFRNIGLCYVNMNSNKKALECFERALEINSSILEKHLKSHMVDENFERACRLDNQFYQDYIQVINDRLAKSPRPIIRSVHV